jgi:prophage regulatory protein
MTGPQKNFIQVPLGKFKDVQDGSDRILRLAEVRAKVGMGTTSIYKYMKDGGFPSQIRLGPRMVGWLDSEVSQWMADQISAARNSGTG